MKLIIPFIKFIFAPANYLLEVVPIKNVWVARKICEIIPCQCPFERDIELGSFHIHIPPVCELNPTYSGLTNLRFRSLNFLAEKEYDISKYVRVS